LLQMKIMAIGLPIDSTLRTLQLFDWSEEWQMTFDVDTCAA